MKKNGKNNAFFRLLRVNRVNVIAVDKNGDQLYNPDGSKRINDERIEAVRHAFEDFEKGERLPVEL